MCSLITTISIDVKSSIVSCAASSMTRGTESYHSLSKIIIGELRTIHPHLILDILDLLDRLETLDL